MPVAVAEAAPTYSAAPSTNPALAKRHANPEVANFWWVAWHQIFLRVGWIFKTESVVVPTFLDFVGGGPIMRGFLMVLSRLGTSVPPVLCARRLKIAPLKKRSTAWSAIGMAAPLALLAIVWWSGIWQTADGSAAAWMPWLFLVMYAIFFAMTGLNSQSCSALQGKLVPVTARGRLYTATVIVGSPIAIWAAWYWLGPWLANPLTGFTPIFVAAAVIFALGGLVILGSREEPDAFKQLPQSPWRQLRDAGSIVRSDPNFRPLAVLAILFSASAMLFPHYAALGRDRLGIDFGDLVLLVCVQNGAIAVLGLFAGPLADRFGNRAALQFTVLGTAIGPVVALGLAHLAPQVGHEWYWLAFIPLGFTPVTQRLLINYTLEVAGREDHPRYIAALGLCLAIPVVIFSPLVGLMIKLLGFDAAFLLVTVALAAASVQSIRIPEPRHLLPLSVEKNPIPAKQPLAA
ncbi:MAG: MFS transporter [Pirellulales bacterium]